LIALRPDLKVVLAAQPVDFRKSVHTLSALVSEALRANPYCGDVFVFRSKRADRVKLLAWDGSGMVLAHDLSFIRHFSPIPLIIASSEAHSVRRWIAFGSNRPPPPKPAKASGHAVRSAVS